MKRVKKKRMNFEYLNCLWVKYVLELIRGVVILLTI